MNALTMTARRIKPFGDFYDDYSYDFSDADYAYADGLGLFDDYSYDVVDSGGFWDGIYSGFSTVLETGLKVGEKVAPSLLTGWLFGGEPAQRPAGVPQSAIWDGTKYINPLTGAPYAAGQKTAAQIKADNTKALLIGGGILAVTVIGVAWAVNRKKK